LTLIAYMTKIHQCSIIQYALCEWHRIEDPVVINFITLIQHEYPTSINKPR